MNNQNNVIHLNRYYHFTELMRDPAVECQLLRYTSNYDKTLQTILIMQQTGGVPKKLFFFFHGMDGDSGDCVIVRDIVKRLDARVVAMGGRGASWVSDAFTADAEQVINEYSKQFKDFYMIGVSMGGVQVLSLSALLPGNLCNSIMGVIALIPGSDLPVIAGKSSNQRVRDTLIASVNGNMQKLQQRSPVQLFRKYKRNLPFVFFYNENDTILLADELEKFIIRLRNNNHPLSVFCAPGDHDFTYKDFDYKAVYEALGKDSQERMDLPLLQV